MTRATLAFLLAGFLLPLTSTAQVDPSNLSGFAWRSIGPAVMGGRIADIAVSPHNPRTWYVGVGSGNVWKTTNAGVTFQPVFDGEGSYSIGSVAVDPNRPDVVWVGTGENVSGRHVAWGDGVYKSRDGGKTWQNMGLPKSEHIGRILIDPRDSDVILVAAEGPLWSSGGDRGVFRSTDGGETWTNPLATGDDTGVTDLEFNPANPDVVYAATYERRRHVWSLLAGGDDSGIWKSTDGGVTWRRIETGLPKADVGKIGLAVTPADPNRVFATLESEPAHRGFYISFDQGESFERRASYTSGGTGPHYYQELEADPKDADTVYQMDVWVNVTRDAGHTFKEAETGWNKHSDNHALWIDPNDSDHMLVGTDGGLYETFDGLKNTRHFPNLPISQFYKVAMNGRLPFYDVLVGAQDLGTLMGPSRTMNVEGVRNRDWYVPLGSDGQGVAFDPEDPDIGYMATQQGNWYRHDKRTEEVIDIQPQAAPGDAPERWNWDAPIHISPHNGQRVYVASQRLWRSDDRGDSWTAVSGDLTRDVNRYELEMMGRVWSVDALYHNGAMSKYSTITGISESPLAQGTIYVGTDDGLIQATTDGGATWRLAAPLPGVHEQAFINDVEASQHEPSTVFAIADNHKLGDYTPYVFRSPDGGRTWKSIRGDLPDGTIAWMIQQDHVNPNLLFLAGEHAIHASFDGGVHWHPLTAGLPTISFRDLQIHRRDNDLVAASFGRGVYILDDYAGLRALASGPVEGVLPVRDAWWYVPNVPMQAPGKPTLGSDDFTTPNPPFGAVINYRLPEASKTMQEARRDEEKKIAAEAGDVPFPGWDRLLAEAKEGAPLVMIAIRNADGDVVRRIPVANKAGLHRTNWDLRLPAPDPVDLAPRGFVSPWSGAPVGPIAAPGTYSAELVIVDSAGAREVGTPQSFEVKPVHEGVYAEPMAFQAQAADLVRRTAAASEVLSEYANQIRHMREALLRTPAAGTNLYTALDWATGALADLRIHLNGDFVRGGLNESTSPSIAARAGRVSGSLFQTTQPPTDTQRESLRIASEQFESWQSDLSAFEMRLGRVVQAMEDAGAPWTPGRSGRQ